MDKRMAIFIAAAFCVAGAVTVDSFAARAQVFKDLGECDGETHSVSVLTNSAKGNVMFTCHGNLADWDEPKVVIVKNPEECVEGLGAGARGHATIRPNGDFVLNCTNHS